jgi:(p)ppGpp synthase/HD superfamily hydrolase
LIEDTDITYDAIKDLAGVEIADAVQLVTKNREYDEQKYYHEISKNDVAKMVKIADRLSNLSMFSKFIPDTKRKYFDETKKYFIDLARGTVYEKDMNDVIKNIQPQI